MKIIVSALLISTGIILLFLTGFLIWQRNSPARLAFKVSEIKSAPKQVVLTDLRPVSILLPASNIELPIIQTELKDGKWLATSKGVSYLISSPIPGEVGNSVLYGHNWPNLLGKLPKVKPGEIISVKFSDGSIKNFPVQYTLIVTPDQTQILNPTSDSRITIYTCTGFLDNKRFVAVGIF